MTTAELVDRLVAATKDAKELLPELHGAVKDARRLLADAAAERRVLEQAIAAASTEGLGDLARTAASDFATTIERMISEAEKTVRRRLDLVVAGHLLPRPKEAGPPAPGRRCPHCRLLIEASTGMGMAMVPSDGDVSICAYCAGISRFDGNTQGMRRQTKAEEAEVAADVDIQAAVRSVRARVRARKSR